VYPVPHSSPDKRVSWIGMPEQQHVAEGVPLLSARIAAH
jgi:hypothetical protein